MSRVRKSSARRRRCAVAFLRTANMLSRYALFFDDPAADGAVVVGRRVPRRELVGCADCVNVPKLADSEKGHRTVNESGPESVLGEVDPCCVGSDELMTGVRGLGPPHLVAVVPREYDLPADQRLGSLVQHGRAAGRERGQEWHRRHRLGTPRGSPERVVADSEQFGDRCTAVVVIPAGAIEPEDLPTTDATSEHRDRRRVVARRERGDQLERSCALRSPPRCPRCDRMRVVEERSIGLEGAEVSLHVRLCTVAQGPDHPTRDCGSR